jgi:hypothetical protein
MGTTLQGMEVCLEGIRTSRAPGPAVASNIAAGASISITNAVHKRAARNLPPVRGNDSTSKTCYLVYSYGPVLDLLATYGVCCATIIG